jgi:SAM-dependent methyltransferase
MDGQHTLHSQCYAYDDSHWAEFYDLWIATIFDTGTKPHEDVAVLWSTFSEQLAAFRSVSSSRNGDEGDGREFKVIDVGTGTGRVIKSMVQCAKDKGVELEGLEMLGVDHGAAMVERAKLTFERDFEDAASGGVRIDWQTCSATDIVARNPAFEVQTDLVIFAAGGLGHLTAEGEIDGFLGQVSRLLRADGVAIISILHETIKGVGGEAPMKGEDAPDLRESLVVESKEKEATVYRKSGTWQGWDETGEVRTDGFKMEVLEKTKGEGDGEMKVVKTKDVEWSLRVFDEEKWEGRVRDKGLKVERLEEGGIQRFYFLRKA